MREGPILVVEDDAGIRAMVGMILESEGFTVMLAANGLEGLRLAARSTPALVVLDMKMPVMDGWGFAREFRGRFSAEIPIVVMTAAADAQARAAEVGAAAFVGKPFGIDELARSVRGALRAARGAA